jgi:predicted transcriptional regulator
MMDRMVNKRLLKVRKIRNLYLYSAAITRPQAQRSEIMKTLKRAFDGTLTPMMQFLIENEELSEKEYRQLEKLIANRKRKKAGSKKGR